MDNFTLKLFSLDVRGLNTYKKRTPLFDWLKNDKYDVIFLQETHFVKQQEYYFNSRWFGEIVNCFSESVHSKGVSVLLNSKIEIINHYKSVDDRRLLISINYNYQKLTLVNVYAPNNEKDRIDFFKRVITWINQNAINLDNVILCGDFNCQIDTNNLIKALVC